MRFVGRHYREKFFLKNKENSKSVLLILQDCIFGGKRNRLLAEVDFVLQRKQAVIPIEVKAE